eukprot:scaffold73605_cov23-Tisochrysis_lutea.AAC.5
MEANAPVSNMFAHILLSVLPVLPMSLHVRAYACAQANTHVHAHTGGAGDKEQVLGQERGSVPVRV